MEGYEVEGWMFLKFCSFSSFCYGGFILRNVLFDLPKGVPENISDGIAYFDESLTSEEAGLRDL